jgi:hypothetical protein
VGVARSSETVRGVAAQALVAGIVGRTAVGGELLPRSRPSAQHLLQRCCYLHRLHFFVMLPPSMAVLHQLHEARPATLLFVATNDH